DALLLPVAAELPADEVLGPERRDCPEDLHLLVADRLVIRRGRRLHGEEADHLQHVVLDHVADGARLLVEAAAALDAEALRHRDLHALDVVAVPDRLEERVREAKEQQVLHRLLAEVVVDAKDRRLVEHAMQRRVERLRRRQVPAEGLLEDDARVARAARLPEPVDHGLEEARRDRQVMERAAGAAELLAERRERGRVAVLAADVAEAVAELREGRLVDPAVPLHTLARPRPELLERPIRPGDADHRDVEPAASRHRMQRREDLLVDEVAAGAEEGERVRMGGAHVPCPFSRWPPNSYRMADSSRSWNSASPREAKRSKSAAARTCAGTASSIAASSVQRPSPESDTRPAKRASVGSLASASAVRSRSHEANTLPRSHTSAILAWIRSYW